jgi:hypothetical protein
MNREQLLEFMKGKVHIYYYEILDAWTLCRDKRLFGLIKNKFYISPTPMKGYKVYTSAYDYIFVYPQ